MRTFREFVEERDKEALAREAILNALEASEDALDDPLANFKKYKELLNASKNPGLADLIKRNRNAGAIINAIKHAGETHVSIADVLALFQASDF